MRKYLLLSFLLFISVGSFSQLTEDESKVNDSTTNTSAFEKMKNSEKPLLRFVGKTAEVIIDDWVPLGNPETNKFDFGRLQTIPTYNPVEGVRLRAGIASNTRLHPNLFVKGYVAYGFRDQRFKYRGEAAWSFNDPVYHDEEFPKNNLRLIYENDIYSPGEMHPRALNDRLLITYSRSKNAMLYRNFTELNYEKETLGALAYTLWVRRSEMNPAEGLSFIPITAGEAAATVENLITSDVGITLRYAFDEEYDQYKRRKKSTTMQSPVLFLSHTIGLNDFLGSEVSYHRTEFSAQKRFVLGTIGRIDAVGEVSKIWNSVPFPLLTYNNQRYRHLIENTAFHLNHAFEFVADEIYTARATFVGDDLLFSKVGFLNKLQIRELLTVRASYGRLSDKNDPMQRNGLYQFPQGAFEYGSAPYVEGTIGITNILGLLRVEYVHRFTYRDHPDALLGKVRIDVTL